MAPTVPVITVASVTVGVGGGSIGVTITLGLPQDTTNNVIRANKINLKKFKLFMIKI